jgi:hypothetical protein
MNIKEIINKHVGGYGTTPYIDKAYIKAIKEIVENIVDLCAKEAYTCGSCEWGYGHVEIDKDSILDVKQLIEWN